MFEMPSQAASHVTLASSNPRSTFLGWIMTKAARVPVQGAGSPAGRQLDEAPPSRQSQSSRAPRAGARDVPSYNYCAVQIRKADPFAE
jgi:hypothetical protein